MTTSNPSSFPRALIIRANGNIEVVANTGLACLQEAVGGYIEAIQLGSVAIMYVNEEGLLREDIAHRHNGTATKIALQYIPNLYHPIVGDVIICGFDPSTGEECDFPDEIGEAVTMEENDRFLAYWDW